MRGRGTRRCRSDDRATVRTGHALLGRTDARRTSTPRSSSTAPSSAGSVPETENAEQTGGYRLALKGGRPVAGMMPQMQEGQPAAWTTYVAVDDAEATAAAVTRRRRHRDRRADGRDGPRHDGGLRRPDRRRLRGLAAGRFAGAGLVNEPGALAWNELSTRDLEAAKDFYGAVFGWTLRGPRVRGAAPTRRSVLPARPLRRHARHGPSGVPDRGPRPLAGLLRRRGRRRDGRGAKESGGGVMVEPIDISESAASRSSPTRAGRASR